jgi:hypothetical protein
MTASSFSSTQEKVISIVPVCSSLLSIFGSTTILASALKTRASREWTTYTRLLICLSVVDIIFSATMASSTFLLPSDTSKRVWAFGTDGTCTALGFLSQFSYAISFYNAHLSFYFLLRARFRFTNHYIARKVEPWMHTTAMLFPLVTALTGAAMDIYNELDLGQGCWITEFPKDCGYGPGKTGEVCRTDLLSWVFGGIPAILSFVVIVLNNLLLFVFVRKYCKPPSARRKLVKRWNCIARNQSTRIAIVCESMIATGSALDPSISRLEEGIIEADQNTLEAYKEDANTLVMNTQQERLRLVGSQALLYVGAALICSLWTGLLRILETHRGKTAANEDELFPLLLLQACFLPLQGFFNLFIWTRPKYQKCLRQCPDQSRLSCFRRALFGNCEDAPSSPLIPKKGNGAVMEEQEVIANDETCAKSTGSINSAPSVGNTTPNIGPYSTPPTFCRLPPEHLSSITASNGDFDDEEDPKTRPWEVQSSSSPLQLRSCKESSLVMISEVSRQRIREDSLSTLHLRTAGKSFNDFFETGSKFKKSILKDHSDANSVVSAPTVFKKVTFRFPDERPKRRWSAGGGSSSMKAPYPTRINSLDDLASKERFRAVASLVSLSLDDARFFDRMEAVGDAAERGILDSPILLPRRRLSPPPSEVKISGEEEESTGHKVLV